MPSIPQKLNRWEISNHLKKSTEKILIDWEERVCAEIPRAEDKSTTILRDSLPEFLLQLANTLSSTEPFNDIKKLNAAAAEHGEDRAELANYTLGDMLLEYGILREVITEEIDSKGEVEAEVKKVLHSFLDRGIRKATIEFEARTNEISSDVFRHFNLISNSLSALVSYMDTTHHYRFVNAAYEKWFEVKNKELVGMHLKDFVGDVVYERALPYLERAMKGEIVEFQQESPYKNGTRFIEVLYAPDVDIRTGKVRGVVSFVYDITEKKKLQLDLEQANQLREIELKKLSTVFEHTPIPMAMMEGSEHRFVFANHHYRTYFLGNDNYLGKTVKELIPEANEQGFVQMLDRVYASGKPIVGNEAYFKQGNREFYLNFVYEPVRNEAGEITGVLAGISDVTPLVLSKNAVTESNISLREERDMREKFVAALSHDLRTPITAAKMSAQLINRKPDIPENIRSAIQRIIGSIDRTENMVQDLLDANRIKAGEEMPLDKADCILNDILEKSLIELQTLHGSRFIIKNDSGIIKGYWDREALQRIIENLATNAVKYGDSSSPITVTISSNGKEASLSVHNNGNPISIEEQQLLFESYRRSADAIMSGQKGWGIGLMLVKGFTKAHEGKVSLMSSAKYGTTFTIELPLDTRKLS